MTCTGCREDGERCPYCGRTVLIEHTMAHDVPTDLPTSGRKGESDD
jgi:rRNA maturation endonuclease Nob1